MKIVHFSDWHTSVFDTPPADVYLCTGDMYPNAPILHFQVPGKDEEYLYDPSWAPVMGEERTPSGHRRPPHGSVYAGRSMNEADEKRFQAAWAKKNQLSFSAPVIALRGNHDYHDLKDLFATEVHEITSPKERLHVGDITFGGIPGTGSPDGKAEWSDFCHTGEMERRVEEFLSAGPVDVLLTHPPPKGILDDVHRGYLFGDPAFHRIYTYAAYSGWNLRVHCFGHIHERGGRTLEKNTILFSNAATAVNVITL